MSTEDQDQDNVVSIEIDEEEVAEAGLSDYLSSEDGNETDAQDRDGTSENADSGTGAIVEGAEIAEVELTPEEKVLELNDKLLRTMSDFENYRRRAMKDKQEMLMYSAERPLKELLPVLDNLRRAVQHAETGNPESIVEGVKMILLQFTQTLDRMEIHAVGNPGDPFDPNLHDALQQIPHAEVPAGHVIDVFEIGYLLRDRLVRPAKVVVSSGAPEAGEENAIDSNPDEDRPDEDRPVPTEDTDAPS